MKTVRQPSSPRSDVGSDDRSDTRSELNSQELLPAPQVETKEPVITPIFKELNPDAGPAKVVAGNRDTPPLGKTDEQLIAAYQKGDRTSFTLLVSRYERELFHFLVRFLSDKAAAEDVFQETFLQVHQSAKDFDTQRRFRPWLFTIAANKARDLIRSNARRPTNPLQASINGNDEESGEFLDLMRSSDESPDAPMEKRELRQKVQSTVTSMPENLREILLLSYFHQFPYKQISDILDIPLGTVKSRLHSAVANFADRWKSANPGQLQA
jgi:RNA polymerase sigma-70 factor (ECF subfamily)